LQQAETSGTIKKYKITIKLGSDQTNAQYPLSLMKLALTS